MNVIVENEQQELLSNIDIDVIKSISGSYDVHEIINMFKDFFYSKMILDVTAIKQYKDVRTYEILARGLDVQKIIFLLPDKSSLCTPNFLSHLISLGIYNFTSKLSGIKYLLKKSNTLQDVEKITGYDEGFKPNWLEEFSKRGIEVYGNIESELGKEVLKKYIADGKIIYKPLRK